MGSTIQSSYRERGVVRKHHNSPCADFLNILDLVLHDLIVLRLTHVQELAAQREDTKVVAPNYAKTGHRERLGGVTFGQNERALGCSACPRIVRVRKLGDASETAKEVSNRIFDSTRVAYRLRFVPSVLLISCSALNFAQFNTFSTIDDLDTRDKSTIAHRPETSKTHPSS